MWILIILLLIQFTISTTLSILNLAHLKRAAASPPPKLAGQLDQSQFPKMIAYSATHSRLGHIVRVANLLLTLIIFLPWLLPIITRRSAMLNIAPVWQGLLVLGIPSILSYLCGIPWSLISSFGIEKKFGFSTITLKTWLLDQVKSLLLSLVLGTLLGGGFLFLLGWLGRIWWLPAWILFTLFQILMIFIAPVLIAPLFNKFEPLQDQELSEKIITLAQKASFPVGGVFQVDASRRSTHSNAYFTGLGKTRRIVLYDTLLEQHTHQEILSILAHEIGHWKKRHILKGLALGIFSMGLSTFLVAALLDFPWIYQVLSVADLYYARGVVGPVAAVGTYVVGILLSPLGLLFAPAANWLSRRREYQADAYALELYPHPTAMADALINLSEKNLSNLFPHPLVVLFYYSHPPLIDRLAALDAQQKKEIT